MLSCVALLGNLKFNDKRHVDHVTRKIDVIIVIVFTIASA